MPRRRRLFETPPNFSIYSAQQGSVSRYTDNRERRRSGNKMWRNYQEADRVPSPRGRLAITHSSGSAAPCSFALQCINIRMRAYQASLFYGRNSVSGLACISTLVRWHQNPPNQDEGCEPQRTLETQRKVNGDGRLSPGPSRSIQPGRHP